MIKKPQISAIRCTSRTAIRIHQPDWLALPRPSQSKTTTKTPRPRDLQKTPLLRAAAPHYAKHSWEDPQGGVALLFQPFQPFRSGQEPQKSAHVRPIRLERHRANPSAIPMRLGVSHSC